MKRMEKIRWWEANWILFLTKYNLGDEIKHAWYRGHVFSRRWFQIL